MRSVGTRRRKKDNMITDAELEYLRRCLEVLRARERATRVPPVDTEARYSGRFKHAVPEVEITA